VVPSVAMGGGVEAGGPSVEAEMAWAAAEKAWAAAEKAWAAVGKAWAAVETGGREEVLALVLAKRAVDERRAAAGVGVRRYAPKGRRELRWMRQSRVL